MRKDCFTKDMVLGVEVNGVDRAYPLDLLRRQTGSLEDNVGEHPVRIIPTSRFTKGISPFSGSRTPAKTSEMRLAPDIFQTIHLTPFFPVLKLSVLEAIVS